MGTPANALQAAIYSQLMGFPALTSLVGTRIYDFVPPEAQPPYVKIGDDTAIDWSTDTESGWSMTVTIHCWDFEVGGRKSVKAIMSAIYDALHRQEASIDVQGFNLALLQWEFEQSFQDPSEVGQGDHFYHGVQRYRALVESI
jgi:Protein of unknown function (DUF3168)